MGDSKDLSCRNTEKSVTDLDIFALVLTITGKCKASEAYDAARVIEKCFSSISRRHRKGERERETRAV